MTALGAPGMQVDLAARRARLAPLEEHMGPAHDWPQWLVNLALKGRLTHADRLTLPVNLIGNVVPPFVAAKFIAPDLTDETAAREVCHFFRKIHEGYYSSDGKVVNYWDIELKMVMPLRFSKAARAGRNRRLRLERLDRSSATRHRRPSGALSPRYDGRCLAARQLDADGSLASPVPTRHLRVGFSVSGFLAGNGKVGASGVGLSFWRLSF